MIRSRPSSLPDEAPPLHRAASSSAGPKAPPLPSTARLPRPSRPEDGRDAPLFLEKRTASDERGRHREHVRKSPVPAFRDLPSGHGHATSRASRPSRDHSPRDGGEWVATASKACDKRRQMLTCLSGRIDTLKGDAESLEAAIKAGLTRPTRPKVLSSAYRNALLSRYVASKRRDHERACVARDAEDGSELVIRVRPDLENVMRRKNPFGMETTFKF